MLSAIPLFNCIGLKFSCTKSNVSADCAKFNLVISKLVTPVSAPTLKSK